MLSYPLEEEAQLGVGRVVLNCPETGWGRCVQWGQRSAWSISNPCLWLVLLSLLFSHVSFPVPSALLFWLNDAFGVWKIRSCCERTCIPMILRFCYYTEALNSVERQGDSESPRVLFKDTHASPQPPSKILTFHTILVPHHLPTQNQDNSEAESRCSWVGGRLRDQAEGVERRAERGGMVPKLPAKAAGPVGSSIGPIGGNRSGDW